MLYYEIGSPNHELTADDLKKGLFHALDQLQGINKVLAIPPDYTRLPSRAGELTEFSWQYYGDKLTDVLPALGTHAHDSGANQPHVWQPACIAYS